MLLTAGISFQVNLLGCSWAWGEFSFWMLSQSIHSSLSGPACVVQRKALSCLGSPSSWEGWCAVEKDIHGSHESLWEDFICLSWVYLIFWKARAALRHHQRFHYFEIKWKDSSKTRKMTTEHKQWKVRLCTRANLMFVLQYELSACFLPGYENMKLLRFCCFILTRQHKGCLTVYLFDPVCYNSKHCIHINMPRRHKSAS